MVSEVSSDMDVKDLMDFRHSSDLFSWVSCASQASWAFQTSLLSFKMLDIFVIRYFQLDPD